MESSNECKHCGESFVPTCHKSRQVFCCSQCRTKHHNAKRYAPPNDACIQCGGAIDLLKNRGKHRKFCGADCRKTYHSAQEAQRKREQREQPRICKNCGKEFLPVWESGMLPRYCSDECRVDFWKEYRKVAPTPEEAPTECGYCGRTLESAGQKYCNRVCYRLGTARARGERRCSWCDKILSKKARSVQKYCCKSCASAARNLSKSRGSVGRCITARNPGAWRQQLTELSKKTPHAPPKAGVFCLFAIKLTLSAQIHWQTSYVISLSATHSMETSMCFAVIQTHS